jgi:hypothetical protein
LVNVKKRQNVQTEDDFVEFEVLIKDNVGDFFTKLGGTLLDEIDLSGFTHLYTGDNIASSYSHTWEDGYKYILPHITPAPNTTPTYELAEVKPAIYAKQYWDRIHANAGFEYTWDTLTNNNVRFDKLLVPFNAEDQKLSEQTLEAAKVIADRSNQPTTDFFLDQIENGSTIPFFRPLTITNEIQDNLSIYDPVTSHYFNQFLLAPPTSLAFKLEYEYDFVIQNISSVNATWAGISQYQPAVRLARVASNTSIATVNIGPPTTFANSNFSTNPTVLAPGEHIIYSVNSSSTVNVTNLNTSDVIKFEIGVRQPGGSCFWNAVGSFGMTGEIRPIVRLKSFKFTVTLDASTVVFGFPINLNSYIPKKIKQSEFVKSICLMYNLFVETDPNNPNRLIYKHRDLFYDSGKVVDWTDKVARNVDQNLKFLPELTSKRLILTYKPDKDLANETYTNATKEIYGQHEVIFQNEYVKNIETKELMFSATPVQTTSFGTVNPLYNGQSPNTNIRILLDNGEQSCGTYRIKNYGSNFTTLTTYPFVSHMDAEVNPSFDINFGVCDFYFYDILNFTTNNLFYNFWARTMAQIDQGKLFTAYFALSEADIQKMKLNDKIRIDNSWWNINKIVDYDAGSNSLTKVELISIDPGLKLPTFRGTISEWTSPLVPIKPVRPLRPVLPIREIKEINRKLELLRSTNTSVTNVNPQLLLMGRSNYVGNEFKGIVIGDNTNIKYEGTGIYVGEWLLKDDGTFIYTGLNIIDAGLDTVMNKMKTNPVDIIDGGIDEVRNLNGYFTASKRIYIDGNPEDGDQNLIN